jgi:hypothetical protein
MREWGILREIAGNGNQPAQSEKQGIQWLTESENLV